MNICFQRSIRVVLGRFSDVFQKISRFWAAKVVLMDRFQSKGGADYPILYYMNYKEKKQDNVFLVEARFLSGLFFLFLCLFKGNTVLVNGIRPLLFFPILVFVFFKKNVLIYLHETEYVFNRIKKENIYYPIISKAISKRHVLCVSESQKKYILKEFKVRQASVVYNAIDEYNLLNIDSSRLNVLMVGSLQERKGVTLFSEVADYFFDNKYQVSFHWIGSSCFNSDKLYMSKNVNWHGSGNSYVVMNAIESADIFFLSSIDDPMPLSVFEAMLRFKKIVCYSKTGTSDLLFDISGCSVFDDYTVDSAVGSILEVFDSNVDVDKYKKINENTSSVESFSARLDKYFK